MGDEDKVIWMVERWGDEPLDLNERGLFNCLERIAAEMNLTDSDAEILLIGLTQSLALRIAKEGMGWVELIKLSVWAGVSLSRLSREFDERELAA